MEDTRDRSPDRPGWESEPTARGHRASASRPESPRDSSGGSQPDRRARRGARSRRLPENPTIDDLIADLSARLQGLDEYMTEHPDDLQAHALATKTVVSIARMLRDRARLTGQDADTIAQHLAKAVDLLLES